MTVSVKIIERLLDAGFDRDHIAAEFGIKPKSVAEALERQLRPDLATIFYRTSDRPSKPAPPPVVVEAIEPLRDEGWIEYALCGQTDLEAFFPDKGGSSRKAKKVCLNCGVRDQCLKYALDHDETFGIWGGLSLKERNKLRKKAA